MSYFLPRNMHKISFSIVFLDLQSHFKGNCLLLKKTAVFNNLKVHKHEIFFLTFFAETETLWSQGPVTRDF
jgi:hypothetical protein